jgi:hemoglobin
MRPSLYEFAGGDEALLALARAHHERCVADPYLNHPFSKEDLDPHHVERLAAYWGEVLGGPPAYSDDLVTHRAVLQMHAGNGAGMLDLGPRFVDCFVAACDDVGLPDDPEFRAALRAYMEWAVGDVNEFHEPGARVPAVAGMPRWDWDGLVTDGRG